ncbi:Aip1p NDAI_0H02250 [Naumovozyma dairenensis CBS 421]|uniref:Anaphase-promoting complex subunit 4 WD40 domain-containing protein n=1 Tax=Naumovozyma dairenensis (strain ATCC 10597 / BCRC 20456 / CBS 421 / NBRC 0211 / NRRL Y-12639) TaxID=1071378 RepID=G0WF38_NAUDC|nr:hypothetical protein NDAI_0H02250 [Naumovozyma dairenensis CBS 421]CCD26399.1 hypothetical protein NDAI_0H02250 [Naumovozyma dairenensis CBS 421]
MPEIKLDSIIPPQPATRRNFSVHLSYDETTNTIAYPCGKSAFIRSLSEDVKDEITVQFTGHSSSNVTVVKFSPIKGSQYVCSGDESGKVIVWGWNKDLDTGIISTTIKSEFQVLAGPITDIAWDCEGKRLAVVGEGRDKFGVFISWDTGNSLGEISGHSQKINAVHFKQSRPMRCMTVGDAGTAVFYQGPPFKFTASDRMHHDQGKFIRDVKFSPDNGEFVVSVGSDRKIVCYDGKTGEFIKYIEDGSHQINGGNFALDWIDSNKFVTASADSKIAVWDVTTSKCEQVWTVTGSDSLKTQQVGVVVATKNNQIVSLSLDGTLNIFQMGQDSILRSIKGHNKGITALATNPLVSGSYDGKVMEWETIPKRLHDLHRNLIVSIDNVTSGKISSVSWDDTLMVNDEIKYKFEHQPKVSTSNDDGMTAVVTSENMLLLLNSVTGAILQSLQLKTPVAAIGLSSKIVSVGYEETNLIEVFDISELSSCFQLNSKLTSTPSCISISKSERYLAAGDVMGKIILFDLETRDIKTSRWSFHTGRINAISWRPEEEEGEEDLVATGSLDTNIIIYSMKKPMRTIKYLNAHKDGINALLWNDANTLVSAGTDACIKKWSVEF